MKSKIKSGTWEEVGSMAPSFLDITTVGPQSVHLMSSSVCIARGVSMLTSKTWNMGERLCFNIG